MDKLKLAVPGKPAYLTGMRLFIGSVAATAGFDIEKCEDIKTAVGEACKNVACHGVEGFTDEYEVKCEIEDGLIEITVADICGRHSLEKIAKPCLNCPKEGDLGIFVIKSLMDAVEFGKDENGYKYIKMTKNANVSERF